MELVFVLLYLVGGSSYDTLLAANCWQDQEGGDIFHNSGRPIPSAFVYKCHTQQTYVSM